MRTKLLIVIAVAVLMLVLVAPAAAVQYGQPDGNGHPYVGLVSFHDAAGVPLWRCTGTLVSPTVFLTAAHCTEAPAAKAVIWFSPGPISIGDWGGSGTSCAGKTGYPCTGDASGTPIPHPGWTGGLTIPNTHDVGVVVLSTPFVMSQYGKIAPLGYLDALATKRGLQNTEFTVVGYGLQSVKPRYSAIRERMVGTVSLVNLRSALTDGYNIQYSSNPGLGDGPGGTCFGDSGGPVFHTGDQGTVIVAVNSFVLNSNCKGAGFGYRTDTSDPLNFLAGFGVTP